MPPLNTPSAPKPKVGLANVWQRCLVHFLGLALMGVLSFEGENSCIAAYIGIICLLPRGDCRKVPWLLNLGLGLLQAVVAFFFTHIVGLSLLLGGFQSWLSRILQPKVRLWNDWVVAFFLIFSLEYVVENHGLVWLWGSVVLLAIINQVAQYLYQKSHAEVLKEEEFKQDLVTLEQLLTWPDFPEDLKDPSRKMLELIKTLYTHLQGRIREGFEAIDKITLVVEELKNFINASRPSQSGWAKGLLKSQNWGRKGQKELTDLSALVAETSQFLTQELRKYRRVSREEGELEAKWEAYEQTARSLQIALPELPSNLATSIESIAKTTFEIVKNMRQDPADRNPGERFLDRYLTAVVKIIEEYQRLSKGPRQQELQEALARSCELLERMDAAFKDELVKLLQNDTINFTAEVEAIDAMLRMRGH